jgi:hypothetical protein
MPDKIPIRRVLPSDAALINKMISEAMNPQGHCVGCGQGVVDRTVMFTPNALPVCSEYCGSKAENWLYPVREVE